MKRALSRLFPGCCVLVARGSIEPLPSQGRTRGQSGDSAASARRGADPLVGAPSLFERLPTDPRNRRGSEGADLPAAQLAQQFL